MIQVIKKPHMIPNAEFRKYIVEDSSKFKKTNRVWNEKKYNSSANFKPIFAEIRKANELYRREFQTEDILTIEYWQSYFLREIKGLTDLYVLAEKFASDCKKAEIILSLEESLIFIVFRVIDQTYNGFAEESTVLSLLKEKYSHLEWDFTSDEEDRIFCVDFVGRDSNKIIRKAVQQKPKSFYVSLERYKNGRGKQLDWVKDALTYNKKGNDKFRRLYGVSVEYVFLENGVSLQPFSIQ